MAAKDETNEGGYHSVPLAEDSVNSIEDDLSSSAHSLKEYHHGQRTTVLMWTFVLAFLASAAVNIGFVAYHSRGPMPEDRVLLTPVPNIPLTKVTFDPVDIYANKSSPETDKAWNALLPEGRGFVYVKNGAQYNLEPGESTPWGELYSVSLFHQLHCLAEIRRHYWLLIDGIISSDLGVVAATLKKATMLASAEGAHVNHCIDYIRQGIMCSGDMALEWPKTEADGVTRQAVDGWGVPHDCKSWDGIMEYMDENHFDHSTNSEIAPHARRMA